MKKEANMPVTVEEIRNAVIDLNPAYQPVRHNELFVVHPPKSYVTEFPVGVWIYTDEIELLCEAGYKPRFIPATSTPEEVAKAIIAFIEENESYN